MEAIEREYNLIAVNTVSGSREIMDTIWNLNKCLNQLSTLQCKNDDPKKIKQLEINILSDQSKLKIKLKQQSPGYRPHL